MLNIQLFFVNIVRTIQHRVTFNFGDRLTLFIKGCGVKSTTKISLLYPKNFPFNRNSFIEFSFINGPPKCALKEEIDSISREKAANNFLSVMAAYKNARHNICTLQD